MMIDLMLSADDLSNQQCPGVLRLHSCCGSTTDLLPLCSDNLIYERPLTDGSERGDLSPFRYFGIADDVDYTPTTTLDCRPATRSSSPTASSTPVTSRKSP